MSQDVIAHKISPGQAEEPLSLQPWSIESYADNLMEELFEDVDQILEGGTPSYTEVVQPEYVSIQPLSMPQGALPGGGNSFNDLAIAQHYGINPSGQLSLPGTQDPTPKQAPSGSLLDKILLTIACTSLLLTGLLGLASQGKLNWLPFVAKLNLQSTTTNPTTAPDPQAVVGEQFVSYMRRSLDLIDQSATAPQASTTTPASTKPVPGSAATNNLPTVPIPTANPVNRPASVLERVYIPIYQPTPPSTSSNSGLPNLPAQLAPAPGNLPTSINVPTAPVPPASSIAVAPPVKANQTLIGIMELGNRSAALFEVNGAAQRVAIGEEIGTSGWTLVKVTSQEAMIRRNGEVRSIFIGQKF